MSKEEIINNYEFDDVLEGALIISKQDLFDIMELYAEIYSDSKENQLTKYSEMFNKLLKLYGLKQRELLLLSKTIEELREINQNKEDE